MEVMISELVIHRDHEDGPAFILQQRHASAPEGAGPLRSGPTRALSESPSWYRVQPFPTAYITLKTFLPLRR